MLSGLFSAIVVMAALFDELARLSVLAYIN